MKKTWCVVNERKCGLNVLSVFLVLSLLVWLSLLFINPPSDGLWAVVQAKLKKAILDENDDLYPTGFDEKSCISRHELPRYWKGEARKPSPHLISKLRSYEARHKRCGPHTHSYNLTLQHLTSPSNSTTSNLDCKYIVFISSDGLGNKMLSFASAFLYALLTDRVLLTDRGDGIPDLFCEPFPKTSWFLPLDFPFTNQFSTFGQQSIQNYGYMIRTNSTASAPYPPFIYHFLLNNADDNDKLFFCDQEQTYLHNVPWLIMKSNQYIAPMFFLMPSFKQELDALFPEKDTVFHLLGRYLFRPTNSVWGLITRFHEAYLSKADVVAGIQIRLYDGTTPFHNDQILSCTKRENILPQINLNITNNTSTSSSTVGVLMISLRSSYFERLRDIYWENPTETGEVVGVFQPSHEEYQQTGKLSHDRKALAEIYLLSFTDRDKLVTSGWSTFGYVAQALSGIKPRILYRPQDETVPDPPCGRGVSLEPCYHTPPHFDCKNRRGGVDLGGVVPHVRQCEDYGGAGLKLF